MRQAELNAARDLDKGERQAAAPTDDNAEPGDADGIAPEVGAAARAWKQPAYEPRRRREYDPPAADEVDVDDEPVGQRRPSSEMGL